MPPKFTKKHYQELARMLGRTSLEGETLERLLAAFSKLFAEDNELFDETRFRKMVERERAGEAL